MIGAAMTNKHMATDQQVVLRVVSNWFGLP